jgi:hypothetical protein
MLADLFTTPARSVDDVIVAMTAIDHRLPDADGLKWFNRLYLRVTLAVRRDVTGTSFGDPVFIEALDVAFANLYFDAVRAAETAPATVPPAWRPLFQLRSATGLARIQFALAGMNAHINRDLPEGIVQAFRAHGGDPLSDDRRRRDFEAVNGLLQRVEDEVKPEFSVGKIADIDQLGGRLDDVVAMWNVRAAREAAWTHSQVLWALGGAPDLRTRFFDRLDRLTGFAGRGLLVPLGLDRSVRL